MLNTILLMLLAVASNTAMAGWVKVGGAGSGMTAYVNPATIHSDGNKVKMWYMHDFRTVQERAAHKFMSTTFQGEFDCKEKQSRILSNLWYGESMGGGNVIYEDSSPTEWQPVYPGSADETLFKYACERKWRWW